MFAYAVTVSQAHNAGMSEAYENQALILNRLNLSLPESDIKMKKNKNVTFFFSRSLTSSGNEFLMRRWYNFHDKWIGDLDKV